MWHADGMPMCTIVHTVNITRLVRYAKKHGLKLNMLMAWCIGKAASAVPEFHNVVKGDMFCHSDELAVQVIVKNRKGVINFCDIPFGDDISVFSEHYLANTRMVYEQCDHYLMEDRNIIGTSTLTGCTIDVAVNQYVPAWTNPFLVWGAYTKTWWGRCTVPISLQFNHIQMDGGHVVDFFCNMEKAISTFR